MTVVREAPAPTLPGRTDSGRRGILGLAIVAAVVLGITAMVISGQGSSPSIATTQSVTVVAIMAPEPTAVAAIVAPEATSTPPAVVAAAPTVMPPGDPNAAYALMISESEYCNCQKGPDP